MSIRSGRRATLALVLLIAACADAPAAVSRQQPSPAPDVVRIVCEADGTTSLSTSEVQVKSDGMHMVAESRLEEWASLNGFGMDVGPGVSEWILGMPPGDLDVACWPFSHHQSGTPPETLRLRVLDPGGLYVPALTLECEAWSAVLDFGSPTVGVADDPVEAVRRSVSGLESDDDLAVRRSGYPEADDDDRATVVVSREGRDIAIFGVGLADDGRWLTTGGSGCVDSGLDLG